MPSLKKIAAEWNRNASARCRQLGAGKDFSHDHVLIPLILRLAGDLRGKSVLDVGCGCGFLAHLASRRATKVLGIDISERMIFEAKERFGRASNLRFEAASLGSFARSRNSSFDVCLSNMSILTMPDLAGAFSSMLAVLRPNGRLVFSTAHPCFWNVIRKDESARSFFYWKPHPVVAPFRITLDQKPLPAPTTYFHRPLSHYVSSVARAGFRIEALVEPRSPPHAPPKYLFNFKFPRFMVLLAKKENQTAAIGSC